MDSQAVGKFCPRPLKLPKSCAKPNRAGSCYALSMIDSAGPSTVRRVLRASVVVALVGGAVIVVMALRIGSSVAPFIKSEIRALPEARVALVLGCSPTVEDGRKNLFFTARIEAAARLFHSGKVSRVIVSGDNGRRGYDEPTAMKSALVNQGVPESKITRDFAGFRTLDSVLRAEQIFGVKELIVVSQKFHVERAVYLARAHGLVAFGYSARDVGGHAGRITKLREVLSRLAAVVDVHLLHTTPRFSGPRLELEKSS